ncbi:MAG: 4'-phosphopantetheinyl transferase superfamily protein [Desulfobacteraceae bacterium]|jgi:4'-phosphopantetheinyl transferase|nr:MAG: 4'-phosphopantetheinyl transferase superfamily protein [Desulfobacteraceae bacterium]
MGRAILSRHAGRQILRRLSRSDKKIPMNRSLPFYIQQFHPFHDQAPCPGDLAVDMIHIWWALLDLPDVCTTSFSAMLNTEEKTRTYRMSGVHRQRFIAARGILRMLLGHYLEQRPETVPCGRDASGKPRLTDTAGPPKIHFSLSHCRHMGLFGFCPNRVIGVDIEQIRPISNMDAIAQRLFSAPERTALREAGSSCRPALFFQLWTMKEAWAKATGEGLRGFKGIEIPGDHAAGDKGEWTYCTDRMRKSWLLRPVETLSGYAAAVAVAADPRPAEQIPATYPS